MADPPRQNITSIVKAYSNRLFGFIRGRVPTTADAEDILQEVWYQFSKVVDTEPIEQVSGWLFRVARNRITDRYRKRSEDSLEDLAFEDEDGELFFNDILLAADNESPEATMLREVFWEALFEALEELPENQREVFVWNELEDQTFQEISDRTGVNIKTLISRKRYAVQHLRTRLQALYEEFMEY
ncbi:MAG: sigma-70 family RNA polymerase sigma factor [Saprospirales bacterium]|nr:sigma-70 family RNA polymerase sigma factor [Saprospirales bacterium]MBK8490393.1 sigma-70 family RNA polymerase sigma factor [Saprospirales bacterium]